jgi:hypothetical protein
MKTVFILAAGSGTRWNNYRGTPKHMLVIEGEVLIERTYRQFSKYADKVIIVANEEQGFAETYIPPENKSWRDIAKFYSSRDIWTEGKNIMVFADVYFTDEAVEQIMSDTHGLSFYLRKKPSRLTKKLWREIWGIGFDGLSIPILESAILKIIESKENYSTGERFYMGLRNVKPSNLPIPKPLNLQTICPAYALYHRYNGLSSINTP